jgi:hypothetical protein
MGTYNLPNHKFRCKISQHLPAAATPADITLAAETGKRHVIMQIDFGYKVAAPAAGTASLAVTGLNDDGARTYLAPVRIEMGVTQLLFPEGLIGALGGAVAIQLPSGGGTSVAELNVFHAQ